MTIRVVIQQPKMPAYRVPVFRELASRGGIDLTVVYGNQPGPPNAEADGYDALEIDAIRLRLPGRTLSWHTPQLTFGSRRRCDVLILSWNLNTVSLLPALLRARASGVPTILWGHGYSKHEAAWRRWPRDRITTLATALLFYNSTASRAFVERRGCEQSVFVAPNSLDQQPIETACRYWSDHPAELRRFQAKHGLEHGPVIIFVSRLEPANRLDVLIESMPLIAVRHPTAQVVIVGNGDEERRRLEVMALHLDVNDRVRFLGPIYDERALAAWFMSANVYCYPANMGLSMLHAFGYSLPVVTGDDLGRHGPEIEALQHGRNGLLCEHGDAAALAAAIEEIVSMPQQAAQTMRREAHRTVTDKFSIRAMVDGMERAIRFAAQQSGGAG